MEPLHTRCPLIRFYQSWPGSADGSNGRKTYDVNDDRGLPDHLRIPVVMFANREDYSEFLRSHGDDSIRILRELMSLGLKIAIVEIQVCLICCSCVRVNVKEKVLPER